MSKKIPVSVALPEEINDRIKTLAEDSNRTKAAYIRQIIRRYLRYLDTYDDADREAMDWRVT